MDSAPIRWWLPARALPGLRRVECQYKVGIAVGEHRSAATVSILSPERPKLGVRTNRTAPIAE